MSRRKRKEKSCERNLCYWFVFLPPSFWYECKLTQDSSIFFLCCYSRWWILSKRLSILSWRRRTYNEMMMIICLFSFVQRSQSRWCTGWMNEWMNEWFPVRFENFKPVVSIAHSMEVQTHASVEFTNDLFILFRKLSSICISA